MNAKTEELIARIDGIRSVDSEEDLQILDSTVTELFQSGQAKDAIRCFFRVFERFPDQDGFGIFWSILHGLESIPGYEPALVESVQRQPSEFAVRMVNRILNGGQKRIGGIDLLNLLGEAASNASASQSVRDEAKKLVEFQLRKD
jgi:hypothetical protein